MLASINLNYSVYVEPNERTFEIYAEHYDPEHKDECIRTLKNSVFYAAIRGKMTPLIEMQIYQFMNIFGDEMTVGTTNTSFVHNQVFFNLDNLCPAYKHEPEMPSPTVYVLTPRTHLIIPTNAFNADTVRVQFDDKDSDAFAYWGKADDPASKVYLDEQIVDGQNDYIIRDGRSSIHLANNTDEQVTCSLSFAKFPFFYL